MLDIIELDLIVLITGKTLKQRHVVLLSSSVTVVLLTHSEAVITHTKPAQDWADSMAISNGDSIIKGLGLTCHIKALP